MLQAHGELVIVPDPGRPVCFLLNEIPLMSTWFLFTSTFSMLPLLMKDGLLMAYIISMLAFLLVTSACLSFQEKVSEDALSLKTFCVAIRRYLSWFTVPESLVRPLFLLSLIVMTVLTVGSCSVAPPPTLPDLFPVLISAVSCAHFLMFFLYFNIVHLWDRTSEQPKKKIS